jgi:SAM-dependent methyltransferase
VDVEERRRANLEGWNRSASGWERRNAEVQRWAAGVAQRLVDRLDPQPGETILELAAGIGDTGFLAAERLGANGTLLSTDFAPEMVAAAERRSAELGLANVAHRVVDAEQIPLEDASVDGVLCRWGYMLMPDPGAAFAETRRVLRPGGRLAFAVWAEGERNPWATLIRRQLVGRGHVPPPDPAEPGMFFLADRDRLRALVRDAGFASLELEDVEVAAVHGSFDDYWSVTLDMSAYTAAALQGLPDDEQQDLRAAVERDAEAFRSDGGLVLPGVSIVGLAR